uniref:Uncharacterized protein n=1 Tax=Romanomermis culicivorax TaxID=13658 RepID=A0A915JRC3_ROMCU
MAKSGWRIDSCCYKILIHSAWFVSLAQNDMAVVDILWRKKSLRLIGLVEDVISWTWSFIQIAQLLGILFLPISQSHLGASYQFALQPSVKERR